MPEPHADPVSMPRLSVIIAARNEEAYIGACLAALLEQDDGAGAVEVVVAANGCMDGTVAAARAFTGPFEARGWLLNVLDLAQGGKMLALNAADRAARGDIKVYLDADVRCEPALLGQLLSVLDRPEPRYATGTLAVAPARTLVTRAYARIWTQLPFVKGGAVGAGLFAVNGPGRARWGEWPSIISDDTLARLHFAPEERIEVPARYHWPMVEGFRNLIRVRRRQDAGVGEVYRFFPALRANEGKAAVERSTLVRLALADPIGFLVYGFVHLSVRLRPLTHEWTRGR
jgi:glycosyltransferase involved in cell wall biosynthesis